MALERVLEPEVMDTIEEAQDYDSMDHSLVNEIFVQDLLATGPIEGEVLDVGTGTAQIPVELCKHTEDCRISAVDLSINMLELARYNIEVNSVIQRVYLQHMDAKALPYDSEIFDVVMSNSIIHHIPNPMDCLEEAVRVCRSGGLIFFRDLMRPENDDQVRRLIYLHAGSENEPQQQMFEDSLRAALSLEEIQALVAELGCDPMTVEATSDRHWTWAVRMVENDD
ncbi:MAG: class I SAM-dependent methyltransferase [Pirellulaceae bacterium]